MCVCVVWRAIFQTTKMQNKTTTTNVHTHSLTHHTTNTINNEKNETRSLRPSVYCAIEGETDERHGSYGDAREVYAKVRARLVSGRRDSREPVCVFVSFCWFWLGVTFPAFRVFCESTAKCPIQSTEKYSVSNQL